MTTEPSKMQYLAIVNCFIIIVCRNNLKTLAFNMCCLILFTVKCQVPKPSSSDENDCQSKYNDSVPIQHFKNVYEGQFWEIAVSDTKPTIDKHFSHVRDYFLETSCGDMAVEPTSAIVNGTDAPDKAWPWYAMIHSKKSLCGGILISDRWVLTAAHCFSPKKKYKIELGVRILGPEWGESVFTKDVKLIVMHENYTDEAFDYDVALVQLDSRVHFSERVRPACLPMHGTVFNSSNVCYISGFGKGVPDMDEHITLQQLRVFIVPLMECVYFWKEAKIPFGKRFVCADAPNMAGACSGDSGGPLSCKDGDRYYVAGITNFVFTKCMSDVMPDVYARVSEYLNWIFGIISKYNL